MSNLSKRIGLIHKLRKLTATEEFFHGGNYRAYVDKSVGSCLSRLLNAHALFDNALHTQQANTKLCLDKFADTAYATIAQMVDIIFAPMSIIQLNQATNNVDQVILR